jgi:hypothetical protein
MAIARRKPDPDGITGAWIAGTASRYASRDPLDVDAAVAELREIANGRGDLLAERAGVISVSTTRTRETAGGRAGRSRRPCASPPGPT